MKEKRRQSRMTTRRAKAIAGIQFNVNYRVDYEKANLDCKEAIVAGRKQGDDSRAAELSEAREFFKQRLKGNSCQICYVTISKGATHCRLHQQGKFIAKLPATTVAERLATTVKRKAPPPVRERNWHISELAALGYWSTPVRKVVQRWKDHITEAVCKRYIGACCYAGYAGSDKIEVPIFHDSHRKYVIELLGAYHDLWRNKRSAERWLIEYAEGGGDPKEHRLYSFREIRKMVYRQCGVRFSEGALRKAAERLRLCDKNAE